MRWETMESSTAWSRSSRLGRLGPQRLLVALRITKQTCERYKHLLNFDVYIY